MTMPKTIKKIDAPSRLRHSDGALNPKVLSRFTRQRLPTAAVASNSYRQFGACGSVTVSKVAASSARFPSSGQVIADALDLVEVAGY